MEGRLSNTTCTYRFVYCCVITSDQSSTSGMIVAFFLLAGMEGNDGKREPIIACNEQSERNVMFMCEHGGAWYSRECGGMKEFLCMHIVVVVAVLARHDYGHQRLIHPSSSCVVCQPA